MKRPTPDTGRLRRSAAGRACILLALLLVALEPAGGAVDESATLHALENATIATAELLGVGVTFPLLLTLDHAGGSMRAVFKDVDLYAPHRGEGPDPHVADRWKHEVAAFRIDRLIGLGLVPPTVVRERQGREGSLQLWIDGAWSLSESGRDESPEFRLRRRLFDALVFNPDRNPGNILVAREGDGAWLIDHSRAFRALPHLPASLGDAPVEVPPGLRSGLAGLTSELLEREVGALLAAEQIDALLARRDLLLERSP